MPETNNTNENRKDQEKRIVPVPVQYVYAGDEEEEISLLDLLAALARQKFLVFWITLIFFPWIHRRHLSLDATIQDVRHSDVQRGRGTTR